MIALLLACLLLTAALGYWVFTAPPEPPAALAREIELQTLLERKKAVYDNLKDLHFERLAGKVADDDFFRTRQLLELEAAAVVENVEKLEHTPS